MTRDLRAELRAKKRQNRKRPCTHPNWREGKKYDTCTQCGTSFPCSGECTHLDCSETRIARGLDFAYQDGCYAFAVVMLDKNDKVLFDAGWGIV